VKLTVVQKDIADEDALIFQKKVVQKDIADEDALIFQKKTKKKRGCPLRGQPSQSNRAPPPMVITLLEWMGSSQQQFVS
jgi:hypothetical protein